MKDFKIRQSEADQRLDVFLAEKLAVSRAQAQKMVKAGQIFVNEKIASAHYKLKDGDEIKIQSVETQNLASLRENKKTPALQIIAETNDYLVINKPAGLIVHGGNGITEPTLTDALEKKYPALRGDDPLRPGIVHRLDKEASGAMVIAKTQDMFESLKEQFQARTVTKKYLALVYGAIEKEHDEITFAIARSAKGYKMAARPANQDGLPAGLAGRRAVTEIFIKQKFINYTLLDVVIKTGRTHQIRVHLAAYGHPIVGDDLYGTRTTKELNKKLGLGRIWLHACVLGFDDLQNRRQEFSIELPPELKSILQEVK